MRMTGRTAYILEKLSTRHLPPQGEGPRCPPARSVCLGQISRAISRTLNWINRKYFCITNNQDTILITRVLQLHRIAVDLKGPTESGMLRSILKTIWILMALTSILIGLKYLSNTHSQQYLKLSIFFAFEFRVIPINTLSSKRTRAEVQKNIELPENVNF